MTTITTTCAGCGRQLAVPERYQGRDLKCPECGHALRVQPTPPAPAAAPVPAPAPAAAPPAEEGEAVRPAEPFAELFTAPAAGATATADSEEGTGQVESTPVYWRLKRVGVISAALLGGAVYAGLGLVIGLVVAVASVFLPAPAFPLIRGPLVGSLAIVVMPLLYGAFGLAIGALTASLYNLGARLVGGVRVLLE